MTFEKAKEKPLFGFYLVAAGKRMCYNFKKECIFHKDFLPFHSYKE